MADIFATISLVSFVLAGVLLIVAVVLFFGLNTKAAYRELKGQPQKQWISNKRDKNLEKGKKVKRLNESPTSKMDIEDEAVTTTETGEEVIAASLMNVYEPGTDFMDDVETDEATEMDIGGDQTFDYEEDFTTAENENTDFTIVKRKILIHSNEIIR